MANSVFMIMIVVVLHCKYAPAHKKQLVLLGEYPKNVGE